MNQVKNRKNIFSKHLLICLINIILICLSGRCSYADPILNSFTCSSSTPTDNRSSTGQYIFNWNCSISVTSGSSNENFDVVVNTNDTTTIKTGGNGPAINYTSPQRFSAQGTGPGGSNNSGSISTSNLVIKNNVSLHKRTTTSYTFTLSYITYITDYGETTYTQPLNVMLWDTSGSLMYGIIANPATPLTFQIPNYSFVRLSSVSTNFAPVSSDFGQPNTVRNTILLGDGTSGSLSYVTSNAPNAANNQYMITLGSSGGSVLNSLTSSGGKARLSLSNSSSTANVDLLISDYGQTGMPALGGRTFAISGNTLVIPANSYVTYSSSIAPLSLMLDIDESSLGFNDINGNINFTIEMTAIGL